MDKEKMIDFQLDEEASTEINRIYTVTISAKLLKEWSKTQSIPGFRTGKVPVRLLKKEEFFKQHLSNVLSDIQKKENINNIFASNYIVDKFDYDSDIVLNLSVEKTPNIPYLDFEKLEVKTFKAIISDENIKTGIKNYSNYHAKPGKEVSRNSKQEDFLDLDIEIEDLKSHNVEKTKQELRLGSNTFHASIENALIDKSLNHCHTHYVNENMEIRITIKSIKESIPLSDEEIIKKCDIKDQSIQEFFRKKIEIEAESVSSKLVLETINKAILETDFEVPLSAVKKEYKKILDNTLMQLNYVKELNLEEFIKEKLGISLTEFEKNTTNTAAAIAKTRFMYYTVAKEQNIKIQESEINKALQSQIRFFNNNIEQTKKFFEENEEAREEMLEGLLFSKISDFLIKKVQMSSPIQIQLEELYSIDHKSLEYKFISQDQQSDLSKDHDTHKDIVSKKETNKNKIKKAKNNGKDSK